MKNKYFSLPEWLLKVLLAYILVIFMITLVYIPVRFMGEYAINYLEQTEELN